jgi:virulence-associated protein VagC
MLIRVSLNQSDGSLIVRLPEEVSFPSRVREVMVARQGAGYVVTPTESTWDDFFARPGCDFPDRDQPKGPGQESIEEPDRDAKPPSG